MVVYSLSRLAELELGLCGLLALASFFGNVGLWLALGDGGDLFGYVDKGSAAQRSRAGWTD